MASDTQQRLLDATGRLFLERGYHGTGLKAVAAQSGATYGSLYHFFPGGKEELAAASLRAAADGYVARVVEALGDTSDVVESVRRAFVAAAATLEETDYADACPIATVALEVASTNETLRQVTAEIFSGWVAGLEALFLGADIAPDVAHDLATMFLAMLEGGFLLSRAAKDPAPMLSLGRSCADAVASALGRR